MYEYIAITIKGKKRNTNEDRIMIHNHMLSNGTLQETTHDPILAVICDGVLRWRWWRSRRCNRSRDLNERISRD